MGKVKKQWTLKRRLKTIWVAMGLVFTSWLFYSMQSRGVDKYLLVSDDLVDFESTDDYYSYTPNDNFNDVLIFYPGALVEPRAYIPLCRKIAEQNIKVYVMKMPWRQSTLGHNKPKELKIFKDATKTYTLAGHSQGAKMAAQFVYENEGLLDKLILIGTTHPRDISLVDVMIPILKIYGSNDGVAGEEAIMNNKTQLPATTKFIRIEGGNHSQFGYYGFQLGDNRADITREEQHAATLEHIVAFIK